MKEHHKRITCENCNSRKNSLFHSLQNGEVSSLSQNRSCSLFKKGQSLFSQGSYPRGIFCLNEGKVKIFSIGDEGKEQIIQIAGSGDIIGFRTMFSGEPYKTSAITLEDCNICFIAKEDFLNLMETNTSLRNNILKELSLELGERSKMIINMAQKTVKSRLACILLILNNIYKDEMINLSREDLANYVGTATETLIRLLKELKDENIINIHTRKIEILDIHKLSEIAGN